MNRKQWKITLLLVLITGTLTLFLLWRFHAMQSRSFATAREIFFAAALAILFGGLTLALSYQLEKKPLVSVTRFVGIWNLCGGALLAVAAFLLMLFG